MNAVHHLEEGGRPSIVHADIASTQFVYAEKEQIYKLNDFNRCRFLLWNQEKDEACGFEVGNNPGTNRSPEEYAYHLETEKIDIYSMGNIFYSLLTGLYPFENEEITEKEAQRKVRKGGRPAIDEKFQKSEDPYELALLKIIEMCWIQDPKDRASAAQVLGFISSELKRQIGPGT